MGASPGKLTGWSDGRASDGPDRPTVLGSCRRDAGCRESENRIPLCIGNEVVAHEPLETERLRRIVEVQLARLAEQEIELGLTAATREVLAKEGHDPECTALLAPRACANGSVDHDVESNRAGRPMKAAGPA